MKLGFLYAGQGSQHPGMGADLYKAFPTFRAVLDSAAEQVDFDLKEISFTDTKGILNQTRYTQPCMVAFAAGMTALLAERDIVPAAAAGLSLGEYSALHAAGVFDADTAVELVAFRGKAMEDAAAGRPSAMVAVLGLDRAALQEACDEASAHGCVVIANYNCPGQLVLGGEKAAVETAAAHEAPDLLAVFQKQHRRHGHHTVLYGKHLLLVHIHLGHNGLTVIPVRQLLHHRAQHFAGAAPRCKKVDHGGLRPILYRIEFLFVQVLQFHTAASL